MENGIPFLSSQAKKPRDTINNKTRFIQQTRGFKESDGSTYAIRTKEDEDDYRYFPEPDLPPFFISSETIEAIRRQMPPLPEAIKKQLTEEYGLSDYDAGLIADDPELTNIFHQLTSNNQDYKSAANWVIGPIKNHLSTGEADADQLPITGVAILIRLIEEGKISYGIASQKVFPYLLANPGADALNFIEQENLFLQNSQSELDGLVEAALNKHATKIADYKKGKKGLISVFVGEVMRSSQGKADARIITEKILDKLKSY